MLNMKNDLNSLLQKEMDRKEFLKLVGVGLVAMTGAASLLKTLSLIGSGSGGQAARSLGYGSSPYGGNKKTRKTI